MVDPIVVLGGFPKPRRLLQASLVDKSDGNFLSRLQKKQCLRCLQVGWGGVLSPPSPPKPRQPVWQCFRHREG